MREKMKLSLVVFLLVLTCGCNAQDPMTAIANSHVEANAPKGELFDKYLERDLTAFSARVKAIVESNTTTYGKAQLKAACPIPSTTCGRSVLPKNN